MKALKFILVLSCFVALFVSFSFADWGAEEEGYCDWGVPIHAKTADTAYYCTTATSNRADSLAKRGGYVPGDSFLVCYGDTFSWLLGDSVNVEKLVVSEAPFSHSTDSLSLAIGLSTVINSQYNNYFGDSSGIGCTGIYSNAFGFKSLYSNIGHYSDGFGLKALYYNTSDCANGFGQFALTYNTGAYSSGFGYFTLQYNDGAYNTAIGSNAFNYFDLDAGSAKTFDNTDINVTTDKIYISAHGFGYVDDYINLKYTQGTSAITGLTNTIIYLWQITHDDTIQLKGGANITDAGSGTGHTVTPQIIYTNSTAVGANAEPDASNQVMLGDAGVTEVKTSGGLTIGGTETINIETATADTGLAITLDTLTGGSDVANIGLVIQGTSFKDGTQAFALFKNRSDAARYIFGVTQFTVAPALVVQGDLTVDGETNLGNAPVDTVKATGLLQIMSDSSTTDYIIIKQSGAEDRHADSSDTRIGLSETDRNLFILDLGDIDTDLGRVKSSFPTAWIYSATTSHYSLWRYNELTSSQGWNLKAPTLAFTMYDGDLAAGNAFTFNSNTNAELDDDNAHQAWISIEPKINQTGTASYTGIFLDVDTAGAMGSGAHNLMDLQIENVSKFKVSEDGDLKVSGSVKPGVISMNIYPTYRELTWLGAGKNTISVSRFSAIGGFSFDSLVCDSVRLGFYATEDTNTVDSLYVASYCGRTFSTIEIVEDGTDATSGSVGHHYKTYACSATIPSNARIILYVKPGRESDAGKTKTRLLLLYGHPQ